MYFKRFSSYGLDRVAYKSFFTTKTEQPTPYSIKSHARPRADELSVIYFFKVIHLSFKRFSLYLSHKPLAFTKRQDVSNIESGI